MILERDSLLLCDNKEELAKLCMLLNKAALDGSEEGLHGVGLEVLGAGRLKKSVEATVKAGQIFKQDRQMTWNAGSYFVWCSEKGEPQDENWLWDYMEKLFVPSVCACCPAYVDFVSSVGAEQVCGGNILVGLGEGSPKGIQENEWMRVFFPSENGQINLSLIEKL